MRGGFTLIEVMVALLVVSLVAGAAVLSLASPKRRAELDDVVGGVVQFDLLTRQYALRHGRATQLVFDLDAGTIRRLSGPGGRQERGSAHVVQNGFRLGGLTLAEGNIVRGRTAIWCSERGLTPTYALRIEGPAGRRWVLFTGLTGQSTVLDDEKAMQQTMSLLSGKGADAD